MTPRRHTQTVRQCHNKFRGRRFFALVRAPPATTIRPLPCAASSGLAAAVGRPRPCGPPCGPRSPSPRPRATCAPIPRPGTGRFPTGSATSSCPTTSRGTAPRCGSSSSPDRSRRPSRSGASRTSSSTWPSTGAPTSRPGTLVERLQRLGMGFGADTNAATSFDHTLYQLELPDTAPADLDRGPADPGRLRRRPAARAAAGRQGARDHPERDADPGLGWLPHARRAARVHGGRHPRAGPASDRPRGRHRESGREALADFYNTWYRPDLMAVVVVGDIDGPAIERQIADSFSGLAPRSPAPPAVDLGHVADFKGVKTPSTASRRRPTRGW